MSNEPVKALSTIRRARTRYRALPTPVLPAGGSVPCLVSLGTAGITLPPHAELLPAYGPLTPLGTLPQDTAVRPRA